MDVEDVALERDRHAAHAVQRLVVEVRDARIELELEQPPLDLAARQRVDGDGDAGMELRERRGQVARDRQRRRDRAPGRPGPPPRPARMLAATAMFSMERASDAWPELSLLAAGGFRDTTRLAGTDPAMAFDIAVTNREHTIHWLNRYIGALIDLRERVAAPDQEEALFRQMAEASCSTQPGCG